LAKTEAEQAKVRGQIWYVGFRPVPKTLPAPWRWFINKQFSHVTAFRYDPDFNAWHFVEWCGICIHVELWRGEQMDNLFAWLKRDGALISYEAEIDPNKIIKFRMPFYCVSWVKHLLGLRRCAAITPRQLFCALKKRGGSVIFEP
jgi:hypothetical protein